MKIAQRAALLLLALVVFCSAFVMGQRPHIVMAQGDNAADADDSNTASDDNTQLPADVRNRLTHIAPAAPQDFRPAVTFWEVLGKVKSRYVDKITDQDHLTQGAIASMLRSLRDPYSRVIRPEELQLDQSEAAGQFTGVGLILGARLSGQRVPVQDTIGSGTGSTNVGPPRRQPDQPDRAWQLVVVDTVPGSAAERAGLQTGDVISKINGLRIERQPLASKTIDDLNLLLNGAATHDASLTVTRGNAAHPMEVHMTGGGPVRTPAVEARLLPHGVLYVRIHLFTAATAEELASAVNRLSSSHPGALMLDLRDNPGGLLSSAEGVIGMLAPGGTAGLLDTHGNSVPLTTSSARLTLPFDRIAVLTNGGTANVAELDAAALHERKGAKIIGSATFGNGLVQTVFPLNQGWAYSLTTGRLRTTTGVDFNEHGLAVDRSLTPDVLRGDSAVTEAVTTLAASIH